MHLLSNKLHLVSGELKFDQLHLQLGLLGPQWRGVHSVRSGEVQVVDGTNYVHRLSIKLHLVCGELKFDQLHLQRWLLGPRWRHVRTLRSRQIQEYDSIRRLRQLPYTHQLGSWKHHDC